MSELSIISVNIDSPEWSKLLIKSVQKFTTTSREIIIVDNGSLDSNLTWLKEQAELGNIRLLEQGSNLGHGPAMDIGTRCALSRFVCVLDIDCHIMRHGWDTDLFDLYHSDPKIRLIGKRGPDHKPLHPPFFFYERQFILENDISFEHIPGVSTDTAQKAYWDILDLGYKVERIEGGPRAFEKVYPGINGQEINLAGKATFFHKWRGTRYNENNPLKRKTVLDGITISEYLEEKGRLFEMKLVRDILEFNPS